MFISSLYSHITLCAIFSVEERLNCSPFDRKASLNRRQKFKLTKSFESTNASNYENRDVTRGSDMGSLSLFTFNSQPREASSAMYTKACSKVSLS